ncbi:hypothetical protein EI94DRAFT_148630 [Lactarius quietus]|nr:hypothetical protein EI94DRAFT_148630 [Lactarius quietus]
MTISRRHSFHPSAASLRFSHDNERHDLCVGQTPDGEVSVLALSKKIVDDRMAWSGGQIAAVWQRAFWCFKPAKGVGGETVAVGGTSASLDPSQRYLRNLDLHIITNSPSQAIVQNMQSVRRCPSRLEPECEKYYRSISAASSHLNVSHRTLHRTPHLNHYTSLLPLPLTRKLRYSTAAFHSSHAHCPMRFTLARWAMRYACTPTSSRLSRLPAVAKKDADMSFKGQKGGQRLPKSWLMQRVLTRFSARQ